MWRNEWMCRAWLSWHHGTSLHTNTLALWPQWSAPRQSAGIVAGCRWIARPKSPWLITEAKYCSAETEDWEQAHKEPAGIQRSRSVVSWWPVESQPSVHAHCGRTRTCCSVVRPPAARDVFIMATTAPSPPLCSVQWFLVTASTHNSPIS